MVDVFIVYVNLLVKGKLYLKVCMYFDDLFVFVDVLIGVYVIDLKYGSKLKKIMGDML